MKIFLVMIFIVLLLSRCSKEQEVVEYYSNGSIKSRTNTLNGVKEGSQQLYFENGNIQAIHSYQNDTISGISSYFDSSGKLSMRASYLKGIKDGPYQIFYRNGNIAEAGNYASNNKRGKIYQYFEADSGRVKNEIYSLDSANKHSIYYIKKFDLNGNLQSVDKPLDVIFPSDGLVLEEESIVKFKLHNKVYDSAIVILFEGDIFSPSKGLDTAKFEENEARFKFTPKKKGPQLFHGKWLAYKKEVDKDSTYEYTTTGLFEETIVVQ